MEVILALLADSANVSKEGKLNILGAFADISATKFPARHPEMQLVLRMEASPAEVGRKKKLEIQVIDEDGQKISGFDAEFEVPPPSTPGERTSLQTMLRLVDTIFPKAGRYSFAVLIDGRTEAEVPLKIIGG